MPPKYVSYLAYKICGDFHNPTKSSLINKNNYIGLILSLLLSLSSTTLTGSPIALGSKLLIPKFRVLPSSPWVELLYTE